MAQSTTAQRFVEDQMRRTMERRRASADALEKAVDDYRQARDRLAGAYADVRASFPDVSQRELNEAFALNSQDLAAIRRKSRAARRSAATSADGSVEEESNSPAPPAAE